MSKAQPAVSKPSGSMGQSPLVRTLSQWSPGPTRSPKAVFSSRLADLVGISEAIELADFFKLLKRVKRIDGAPQGDVLEQYWQLRRELEAAIDVSFVIVPPPADGAAEVALGRKAVTSPVPTEDLLASADAFKPWLRFYGLQQSELDRRIGQLRGRVLQALQAHSDALAQVAAIEQALERIMVGFSRRCLSAIPKLLEHRFEFYRETQRKQDESNGLVSAIDDWLSDDGWLTHFYDDSRGLLKTELALRLQPIEGLLMALGYDLMSQDTP